MTGTLVQKQLDSVRKRDGQIVSFDPSCVERAIIAAFKEQWNIPKENEIPQDRQGIVSEVLDAVISKLKRDRGVEAPLDVERIQDVVELILMRLGHYDVAKRYIVYREDHARARKIRQQESPKLTVKRASGQEEDFQIDRLNTMLNEACRGLERHCSQEQLQQQIITQLFDGISPSDIRQISILTARGLIEQEVAYDRVAARLLQTKIDSEVLGQSCTRTERGQLLKANFQNYIQIAIDAGRMDPRLKEFDLAKMSEAMQFERDALFPYLGLQTLYDRYLLFVNDRRIEAPQYFWMRVAMGLAQNESNREEKAIEFYEVMSTFRYVPSTPTLFNSGTCHPQLSSCYLSTVEDNLEHIFKVIGDNAKLSKWAGGLGNDWTPIRATNSHIQGTNGKSQGLIPFLKIVNDTAVAVNQGGKRKGAVCSYLETWHLDIEEFLDLRKNTGDDRRRAHDMNTANWIPDLFMKRVRSDQLWTLFSPSDTPDLHDLYGAEFEKRYEEYEAMAIDGKIKEFRQVRAVDLWRKMLSRLFETGHPWITWKDPSNLRSMQKHKGVVHSSNLCTEILLNTSSDETAVCNLGSVNLKAHIVDGQLDQAKIEKTISTAIRMLDNVVDINFYPIEEAKTSNGRHRPVGLGMMGFQDVLHELGIAYDSEQAVQFADRSMEMISYYAILSSSKLAEERGSYSSYEGSSWSQGKVPLDTLKTLQEERGEFIDVDQSSSLDWDVVRKAVKEKGMRNSYVMAIAPTATISLIVGVSQSIEPYYAFLYTKSNLSGEFTAVNVKLVEELKKLGLWDQEMLDELKYHDGSVQQIERIPQELRNQFKTSFEVGSKWLIQCASRRQKWLDMGQSLNLYLDEASGKMLDEMYMYAWIKGLKTTYYLRTKAKTQVEKSTLDVNKFGIQPKWMKNKSASSNIEVSRACSLEEGCESCQ